MDDSFLFNKQKEQEQNIIIKEQEKAAEQSNMQPLQQRQNETAITRGPENMDPMQKVIYDKFVTSAEKEKWVNASTVAAGSPIQEYKPKKESVKKKVSNWWNRSKNTQKAREKFKNENADYMTLALINQYSEASEPAVESMKLLEEEAKKNNVQLPAGTTRCALFMFQGYKKDDNGQPADEKEKAKMKADMEVIKGYGNGELEKRRPILNRLVNDALSFKISPDMFDKEYIRCNFMDMQRKINLLGELEGLLLKTDKVNQQYYDSLPERVKARLKFLEEFHGKASLAFSTKIKLFHVTENGTFRDYTDDNEAVNEYPIEKNGEIVEKEMTDHEFHYHNYITFYKENKSKINGADSNMTIESAVKEEYVQKYGKDAQKIL